jgi:hypothetical protein
VLYPRLISPFFPFAAGPNASTARYGHTPLHVLDANHPRTLTPIPGFLEFLPHGPTHLGRISKLGDVTPSMPSERHLHSHSTMSKKTSFHRCLAECLETQAPYEKLATTTVPGHGSCQIDLRHFNSRLAFLHQGPIIPQNDQQHRSEICYVWGSVETKNTRN